MSFRSPGISLPRGTAIQKHKLFLNGTIEVQEEGSQLLTYLLNVKRGNMVADFCAGAGGKTLGLSAMGTALYEAAAALFIANLVGIDLALSQQLILFFIAMVASIGAPGIPSAGMVTMAMVLQVLGLPLEALALLLPMDRLLDTFRTTINVEGDLTGALIVQKISKL